MPAIVQLATPSSLPVVVADAMRFARVDDPNEADMVTALIQTGWRLVEDYTGRALLPTTYRWQDYAWPDWDVFHERRFPWSRARRPNRAVLLARSPLVSVQNVKYYDEQGTQQTISSGNYALDTGAMPGSLIFHPEFDIPGVDEDHHRADNVSIDFTAGPATVDPILAHAVRLYVSHFYDNRTPVVTGTIATELPKSVQHLLRSQRVESSFQT